MLTVLSSSKSLNALRISSLESFSLWKEITKISDSIVKVTILYSYSTCIWYEKKLYVVSLIVLTIQYSSMYSLYEKKNLPSFTEYAAAQNKERETKTHCPWFTLFKCRSKSNVC